MSRKSKQEQPDTTLSESNYRDFAKKKMIEAYEKKNMIDVLLWSAIIGYYEKALKEAGIK